MTFTRTLLSIFLLLSFCALTACSNPEKEKEIHFQKALEYIKQEKNNAAIIELRNAVALDGKFAKAHYQLGLLYIKEKDPAKAFKSFHRAVSLDPNNLDAAVKLAEFYLISRKKEESRKYIEQVLKKQPDYEDGLALLANLELIDGNFDKASDAVNKALEKNPTSARLFNIKGRIYAGLNETAKAEEMFKKSIEYDPDNFANYRTLLIFYQRVKNQAEIDRLLPEMVKLFPDNPQPHVILGTLYHNRNEFEKAEKELKAAIATQPDNIQLHLVLLEFYKKQRKLDTAVTFLKEAISRIPDSLNLKISLADLQFDVGKYDLAKETMEQVLKENKQHGGANLLKAKFLIKDRKSRDAITILNPLVNDYPRWAEPSFQLAVAHLGLGEANLARKAIDQALQKGPATSKYHTFLAQLYLLQGEGNSAGKEATIAIQLDSKNFPAAVILTKAMILTKKHKEAIVVLNKMLEKAVDHPELLGNLGLAYIGLKDEDNAIKTFTRLMSVVPGNSMALSILSSLTSKKDPEKAIQLINEYIQKAPKSAGHHLLLGNYYVQLKDYDNALSEFLKSRELDSDNPQSYLAIGRLMVLQGKTEEAINEYRQLLKTTPDSIAAHMGLATLLESQGDMKEAIASYRHILEIQPGFASAANNLAWIMANSDEPDLGEALRLAMTAKKALPDNPNITDTLGWVHFKRKSYSLAQSQFEYALVTNPDNPSILYHLALTLNQLQDPKKAIQHLEKALASPSPFAEKEEAKKLLKQLQQKDQ